MDKQEAMYLQVRNMEKHMRSISQSLEKMTVLMRDMALMLKDISKAQNQPQAPVQPEEYFKDQLSLGYLDEDDGR